MSEATRNAVVKAAMRWFNRSGFFFDGAGKVNYKPDALALERACERHHESEQRRKK